MKLRTSDDEQRHGTLSIDGVYSHPILRDESKPLSAFLVVGRHAWLGFEGANKLYRIKLRSLEKVK